MGGNKIFRNEQAASQAKEEVFQDGYPADMQGTSRAKVFGQAAKTLENKHLGADVHVPKARMGSPWLQWSP